MSARIIELSSYAAQRGGASGEIAQGASDTAKAFYFWRGASGRGHVHTVYSLIDCPELPRANYVLVHRDATGRRTILRLGRAEHDTPSLNLAEVRHRGAKLGANEVHVSYLAASEEERQAVELDLRLAFFSDAPTSAAG